MSAEELEESIRSAAAPFVNTAAGTHLNKIQLDNPKIKFQARLLSFSAFFFYQSIVAFFIVLSFFDIWCECSRSEVFLANQLLFFTVIYCTTFSTHMDVDTTFFYFMDDHTTFSLQHSSSYGNNQLPLTHLYQKHAKRQVMKAITVQTGHEIPNKDIATIQTLKDIHSTLFSLSSASKDASENPKGHVVAEWFQKNQSSLPPNMMFIPYAKAKGVKAEDRQRTNKRFL